MTDFDWARDRRLQFMLKLDYAVLVDPRTPVRSGIGAVVATAPKATPAASSLTPRAINNNNSLGQYCIYIKWCRGKVQSGKFAPLPLGTARTRDDGRINVVFPPADTNYELNFSVDFGSGAGLDGSKRFTISVYILRFNRTAVDSLWDAAKRTQHFRVEDDANQVARTDIVVDRSVDLTDWLRTTRSPSRRRQAKVDLSPHDLLVLDFAILRHDDVLPASIQVMPFDDRSAPATASPPAPSTKTDALNTNNNNSFSSAAAAAAAGSGFGAAGSNGHNKNAAGDALEPLPPPETIVSEPDIRPGILIHSRSEIFRALSATIGQTAVDAKTSIGLTHLLSIFETGNRAVLKLPGLSTDAAFSLLLSNDSPFMTTFHEKRKDRGFVSGPWRELVTKASGNSNNNNSKAAAAAAAASISASSDRLRNSVRMRITGGEMRLGGSYFDATEHSFLVSYQVPSDPQGVTNYVGHFHLQGSGMASAARVELAIHVGHGLFDSITAATTGAGGAASAAGSATAAAAVAAANDASTSSGTCCTVHFALVVVFSSSTIESRFRAKADSMIPKMLNALSTTARALLGADDLAHAAQDEALQAEGKKFIRRHDARVSVDPLLALRPFAMKSNPCIVQHFLRLAAEQEATPEQQQLHPPMAPLAANFELIAAILTMHFKHESIVRLAIGLLSRCLGRHGRSVITRCPGLSDAVERARAMYNLEYLSGGMTTLDQTVEQLLDRQVHDDVKTVGVWRVLEGKSKVSRLPGNETSFFMGDIHRVRVVLPALREAFTAGKQGAGGVGGGGGALTSHSVTPQNMYINPIGRPASLAAVQLTPEQVQTLIALLSLHLNERAVVDTVTYCIERTSTTCLVASTTLQFLLMQNVWNLYPEFRGRLEHLSGCFAQFDATLPAAQRALAKKFGGAALCEGDAVFQCPITLYEPVEEGDCDLILTRKSLYLGHLAFPLEHLYTIARTKVYWVVPAFKIVSQKPKAAIVAGKKEPLFEPLKDDVGFDEDSYSLLEGNKVLDDAFRDLDASVAANFGAEVLGGSGFDNPTGVSAAGRGGGGGDANVDDWEMGAPFASAPFSGGAAASGAGAAAAASRLNSNGNNPDEVAVTYLAKCWSIDELFAALNKIGFGGRITTD